MKTISDNKAKVLDMIFRLSTDELQRRGDHLVKQVEAF